MRFTQCQMRTVLDGLDADHIAGYRTPAGTGTGMAFAYWE
jgi:hypothetical protein